MQNKVIWLTGASSGIGEAFAKKLFTLPCKLAITARNSTKLQELVHLASSRPAEVKAYAGDVTDIEQMRSIANQIEADFGALDILVANAGTHVPTDVTAFDVEQYRFIMEINFFGVLNCIDAVLPKMRERRSGHIVGVASVAGYRGLPEAAAYGASKSAIAHFLESLRLDVESFGIDVSVVSPGFVKTPLTDKNDFEMPFLISAEQAAEAMVEGITRKQFEVHFPKRFTLILKFLRILPISWYHFFIKKTVKK